MKNRHWICYLVDSVGLMLMLCAGLALATALHRAGTAGEAQMMMTYRNCMMTGVVVLLLVRSYEIARILVRGYPQLGPVADKATLAAPAVIVEILPVRKVA